MTTSPTLTTPPRAARTTQGTVAPGAAVRVIRARRLALWSSPVLLALLLFAGKVAWNEFHYGTGNSAYEAKDFGRAQEQFAGNDTVNLWQRWIAPFNVGDAQFGNGDLTGAIASFEDSLSTVPQSQECTVRINLATVHEAQGDALQQSGDDAGARGAWQVARKVLADGNCPTDAGQGQQQSNEAQSQDQRLADKLGDQTQQQSPQPSNPTPTPGDSPTDSQSADPDQQQLDQLDQLNDLGQQNRQDNQDLQDSPNRDWGYHW